MTIAVLYNTPLNDEQKAIFDFAHADHHRRLIAHAHAQFGVNLPEYVLDPFNVLNPDAGLLHQQMHDQIDALYGIAGYDLYDVDWKNEKQRSGWIWLNAQLHQQEATATGIF